jgi:hypothetical protein
MVGPGDTVGRELGLDDGDTVGVPVGGVDGDADGRCEMVGWGDTVGLCDGETVEVGD